MTICKLRNFFAFFILCFSTSISYCQIKYSTGGFYTIPNSGREVFSLNPGWRFVKENSSVLLDSACKVDFDDSKWEKVSLPNGIEYLPMEASGGVNYRGKVWYRKHFSLDQNNSQKRFLLCFEAIMGKSKIWVNGSLVKEHFGGFLPISVDVTKYLKIGQDNLIAVLADNSDDPMFPPGKPQDVLDFCYFGGIYRDCWLISTDKNTYITDPNGVDKIASGGVFISYPVVNQELAVIEVNTDFCGKAKVKYTLKDNEGNEVDCYIKNNRLTVKKPSLWSPESPYLYQLEIRLVDNKGSVKDGYMQKIGIRSIEFSHTKGFVLNGTPYPRKLIGANRHQDFAEIGNALSNNLHYRDAQKLKEAGFEIIRNAHYPQDPAFMDACDELGLFVIVNTPGWQFWNDSTIFEERVYNDIRNMVRRDRNRPSVIMWEPILNETWYPQEFAKNVNDIVKQESKGAYTASDLSARGSECFDVMFTHPLSGGDGEHDMKKEPDSSKVYFTREFGDNVDDWNSHNSPSRVARQWGEIPQLVQAFHYCKPDYHYTSFDVLTNSPVYHLGGTLWHSFDHQRGYHTDPFYGGIMDSFRRPKFSYYMFQSVAKHTKPMVYIANEMTPFSPNDVTVFSNCHSVRLHTITGDTLRIQKREGYWFTFKNAWNFMGDKFLARQRKHNQSYILAEGLDQYGNVIASDKKTSSRRAYKLQLIVDTMSAPIVADGSDLVVVTAQMVDANGVVKRLNNSQVVFTVEGEAQQVGYGLYREAIDILWGETSTFVQTTTNVGKIKVKAELVLQGSNTPLGAEVEFVSVKPVYNLVYRKSDIGEIKSKKNVSTDTLFDRKVTEEMLREVEQQQEDFGENR